MVDMNRERMRRLGLFISVILAIALITPCSICAFKRCCRESKGSSGSKNSSKSSSSGARIPKKPPPAKKPPTQQSVESLDKNASARYADLLNEATDSGAEVTAQTVGNEVPQNFPQKKNVLSEISNIIDSHFTKGNGMKELEKLIGQNPTKKPVNYSNSSGTNQQAITNQKFQMISDPKKIIPSPNNEVNSSAKPSPTENTFFKSSLTENTLIKPPSNADTFIKPSSNANTLIKPSSNENTFINPSSNENTSMKQNNFNQSQKHIESKPNSKNTEKETNKETPDVINHSGNAAASIQTNDFIVPNNFFTQPNISDNSSLLIPVQSLLALSALVQPPKNAQPNQSSNDSQEKEVPFQDEQFNYEMLKHQTKLSNVVQSILSNHNNQADPSGQQSEPFNFYDLFLKYQGRRAYIGDGKDVTTSEIMNSLKSVFMNPTQNTRRNSLTESETELISGDNDHQLNGSNLSNTDLTILPINSNENEDTVFKSSQSSEFIFVEGSDVPIDDTSSIHVENVPSSKSSNPLELQAQPNSSVEVIKTQNEMSPAHLQIQSINNKYPDIPPDVEKIVKNLIDEIVNKAIEVVEKEKQNELIDGKQEKKIPSEQNSPSEKQVEPSSIIPEGQCEQTGLSKLVGVNPIAEQQNPNPSNQQRDTNNTPNETYSNGQNNSTSISVIQTEVSSEVSGINNASQCDYVVINDSTQPIIEPSVNSTNKNVNYPLKRGSAPISQTLRDSINLTLDRSAKFMEKNYLEKSGKVRKNSPGSKKILLGIEDINGFNIRDKNESKSKKQIGYSLDQVLSKQGDSKIRRKRNHSNELLEKNQFIIEGKHGKSTSEWTRHFSTNNAPRSKVHKEKLKQNFEDPCATMKKADIQQFTKFEIEEAPCCADSIVKDNSIGTNEVKETKDSESKDSLNESQGSLSESNEDVKKSELKDNPKTSELNANSNTSESNDAASNGEFNDNPNDSKIIDNLNGSESNEDTNKNNQSIANTSLGDDIVNIPSESDSSKTESIIVIDCSNLNSDSINIKSFDQSSINESKEDATPPVI